MVGGGRLQTKNKGLCTPHEKASCYHLPCLYPLTLLHSGQSTIAYSVWGEKNGIPSKLLYQRYSNRGPIRDFHAAQYYVLVTDFFQLVLRYSDADNYAFTFRHYA